MCGKDARKPGRIELSCTELEICGGHQMSKAIIQVHRTTASKRMCHALSKRKDSHKRIREAVACVCERNRAHPPPCAATHTPKRQTRSRTCANVGGGVYFFSLLVRACRAQGYLTYLDFSRQTADRRRRRRRRRPSCRVGVRFYGVVKGLCVSIMLVWMCQ